MYYEKLGIRNTALEQNVRLQGCPKDDTMIVSLSQSSRLWESTVLVSPNTEAVFILFL